MFQRRFRWLAGRGKKEQRRWLSFLIYTQGVILSDCSVCYRSFNQACDDNRSFYNIQANLFQAKIPQRHLTLHPHQHVVYLLWGKCLYYTHLTLLAKQPSSYRMLHIFSSISVCQIVKIDKFQAGTKVFRGTEETSDHTSLTIGSNVSSDQSF